MGITLLIYLLFDLKYRCTRFLKVNYLDGNTNFCQDVYEKVYYSYKPKQNKVVKKLASQMKIGKNFIEICKEDK